MRRRGRCGLIPSCASVWRAILVLLREANHDSVLSPRLVLGLKLYALDFLFPIKLLGHREDLLRVFTTLPWPREASQAFGLSLTIRSCRSELALADGTARLLDLKHPPIHPRSVLCPDGCT